MAGTEVDLFDVIAIGEGQIRLDTPLGIPLEGASSLSVHVSGTEGNALGLLARLGNRTRLLTALPDSPLGRHVVNEYRKAGIDTSGIIWRSEGRVALYFVEHSSPPVPSRVIFDRSHSCFSQLTVGDFNWQSVLRGRLLHSSGITAALTDNTYEIVQTAMDLARQKGSLISIDVNYRARLWDPAEAQRKLAPLLSMADIVFCSRRDAQTVFGIQTSARDAASVLADRYGAATVIVSDGARAIEVVSEGRHLTATPPDTTIIDRVGAGDAFVGGFLHGMLKGDPSFGLRLGMAAAALALTHWGDQVHTTLQELTELSNTLGRGPDILR
jgi:2-dehydro-3-deoxygluconokinase